MLRDSSSSMASIQGSFTNSSGSIQPVSGTFCVTFSIIQILKVLESLLLRVVYLPINTIALYNFTLRFLPLSSWT